MKVKKILILVEMNNGKVHQVLTSPEKKEIMLNFLSTDEGVLQLSAEVEPVTLEPA
jgi:hypothetical protein